MSFKRRAYEDLMLIPKNKAISDAVREIIWKYQSDKGVHVYHVMTMVQNKVKTSPPAVLVVLRAMKDDNQLIFLEAEKGRGGYYVRTDDSLI